MSARRRRIIVRCALRSLARQLAAIFADGRCDWPLDSPDYRGNLGRMRNGAGWVPLSRSPYEDPPDPLSSADRREWTLDEVGELFGRNRERIRQIEAKALRKLRHPSRARMFDGFLAGRRVVS